MNLSRLVALGSIATLASLVEFASRFGRTIVLSHTLSPIEFGIGAAITLMVGIAELTTDLALDRFLILRADDDGAILDAMHGLSVLRGAALAIVVFVAAPWVADFLGAGGNEWSFRAVAGVIFLRSCAHLEVKQVQRHFRYAPDAIATILAHTCVFASVYPAARFFGDHRAVVAILFVECSVYVVASHLMAQRPFRIVFWRSEAAREAVRYGVPLMLNGVGLAAMSQLDRAVVSHWFGIEALALYTVILNLTVIPISAIYRVMGQVGMSFLARVQGQEDGKLDLYLTLVWAYAVAAGGYALFVAATADTLAPGIFGAVYRISPSLHVLITLIVWVRLCRGAQTLMLLSSGHTTQLTASNLVASFWPLIAIPALFIVPRIEVVLAAVLLGDIVSLATFILTTRRHLAGVLAPLFRDLGWSLAAVLVAISGLAMPSLSARVVCIGLAAALLAAQFGYGARQRLRGVTVG